jgi:hypothetical protein
VADRARQLAIHRLLLPHALVFSIFRLHFQVDKFVKVQLPEIINCAFSDVVTSKNVEPIRYQNFKNITYFSSNSNEEWYPRLSGTFPASRSSNQFLSNHGRPGESASLYFTDTDYNVASGNTFIKVSVQWLLTFNAKWSINQNELKINNKS